MLGAGAFAAFSITAGNRVTLTYQNGFPAASQQPAGQQQLTGYITPAMAAAPIVGPVPGATTFQLLIALPLQNQTLLATQVQQVSDPTSPSYRQFISPDTFVAKFGPSTQTYQDLVGFAQNSGMSSIQTFTNRFSIVVTATASVIENAFFVNLNYYQRPDGTQFYAPDREPSLNLGDSISSISRLDDYTLPRSAGGSAPLNTATQPSYGGSDFRNAYASGPCSTLNGANQYIGIVALNDFLDSDITGYENMTGLTNVPAPQRVTLPGYPVTINNPDYHGEVTLDIEMAMAMAPGAQIIVYEAPFAALVVQEMLEPLPPPAPRTPTRSNSARHSSGRTRPPRATSPTPPGWRSTR